MSVSKITLHVLYLAFSSEELPLLTVYSPNLRPRGLYLHVIRLGCSLILVHCHFRSSASRSVVGSSGVRQVVMQRLRHRSSRGAL